MNIQSLPQDTLTLIFIMLTSKGRADVCSVSSWFCQQAIGTSMLLSKVPELYSWPPWAKPSKELRRLVAPNEYHLIVRLKNTKLIKLKKVCKNASDRDSFDVAMLLIMDRICIDGGMFGYRGIFKTACKSGSIELVDVLIKEGYFMLDDEFMDSINTACKLGQDDILKLLLGTKNIKQFVSA